MATTVESPGITSAKEEAAAILFAREPQTTPVMSAPASEQPVRVHAQSKYASFASYHEPESIPARPKVVNTATLRPYEKFDEVAVTVEPQVLHPYIDNSEYLSAAAAATSVATPPVTTVAETPKTTTVVESPLDLKLEEDTQYVVKFKNSTIVAMTILATIFLLMSVLFVVNIVNLVTTTAEINNLIQESTVLEQTLQEEQTNLNRARAAVDANHSSSAYHVQYVAKSADTSAVPANTTVNSSFFDWLCHALSRLFN